MLKKKRKRSKHEQETANLIKAIILAVMYDLGYVFITAFLDNYYPLLTIHVSSVIIGIILIAIGFNVNKTKRSSFIVIGTVILSLGVLELIVLVLEPIIIIV